MKIEEIVRDVQMSADVAPQAFKIKGTSKAFKILSDKLYSDKVKAIVRELSTNAADAMVMAGKGDQPFSVHLPNNLEPFFSVRDDGIGMSDDVVHNLYTTYFDSDKTDSDELTGCLGLGSKSPFSYTEQFTVESRHNGKKGVYNCFINESGVPSVAKLGESDTTECNGVEVKFAVKAANFSDFRYKAADVLSWFKVQPVVTGVPGFTLTQHEYLTRNESYGLAKVNRYGKSYIVMGNVSYAVNSNSLYNVGLDEIESKLLQWGIDLYVNIGEVEFTAGREEVSYEKKTIETLKKRLSLAAADIRHEIESQIGDAPSIWQARRALHNAKHSILGQVRANLGEIMYKGQAITEFVKVLDVAKAISDPDHFSQPMLELFTLRKENYKRAVTDTIHADGNLILINDLERGGYARVVQHLKEEEIKSAYMLTFNHPLEKVKFLKATGVGEVAVYASSLPKVERKATTTVRQKSEKATLNEFCYSSSTSCSDYWRAAEIDLSTGGVYVEINYFRYKAYGKEECQHPQGLKDITSVLTSLEYGVKVYGVRPPDVYKLNRHGYWVALDKYLDRAVENNKHLASQVDLMYQYQNLSDSKVSCLASQTFLPGSELGQYLEKVKEAQKCSTDPKVKAYARLLNMVDKTVSTSDTLRLMRDKAYKRYPMLDYIDWYKSDYSGFARAMMDYVNLVDANIVRTEAA